MTSHSETFTVIDVLRRLGIPLIPAYTWAAGQAWARQYFKQTGEHGEWIVQPKTNPNPSVPAGHTISSYPMVYFMDAYDFLDYQNLCSEKQQDMFT